MAFSPVFMTFSSYEWSVIGKRSGGMKHTISIGYESQKCKITTFRLKPVAVASKDCCYFSGLDAMRPPERLRLAQLGATLGREFSYELLQAVSSWDESIVQRGLHQLVEAEFLYQQG